MTAAARSSSHVAVACAIAALVISPLLAQEEGTPPAGQAARGARGGGGGGGRGPTAEIVQAALADITPAKGPYSATWESVSKHQPPDWYRDAKLGIGMHWGLYAVPAHASEWYVRHMYGTEDVVKWHQEHFGPQDKFGYKDFIPLFTAAKFNADEWAQLFKDAGARYVMPTAEHHDGFAMWDSALTKYDAKDMGPHRDLIGELATAVHKAGMKFGVTNHRVEHFNFINPLPEVAALLKEKKADLYDPAWQDFYWVADRSPAAHTRFLNDWVKRNYELIDKYHLDTLWWDNGINSRAYDPLKLAVFAHFYNRAAAEGREVTMLTKGEASLGGHVQDYERWSRAPKEISDKPFEVHDSPSYRWGYLEDDATLNRYWKPAAVVDELIEAVCRNGNLLLNLSPRADGTIPEQEVEMLRTLGRWLRVNGEAIYATRPWTRLGEGALLLENGKSYTGADIRFTTKGDTLYAIFMAWPGEEAHIKSLATGAAPQGRIDSVTVLGDAEELEFAQDSTGLHVKFPPTKPGEIAYTLKITGLKLHP
jgi:alpha-L-fucosidase